LAYFEIQIDARGMLVQSAVGPCGSLGKDDFAAERTRSGG
jgi:hypothetical protein